MKPGTGKWSPEEEHKFIEGLAIHGQGNWVAIAEHIGSRANWQVKSHAQKHFMRLGMTGAKKVKKGSMQSRKKQGKSLKPEHDKDEDRSATSGAKLSHNDKDFVAPSVPILPRLTARAALTTHGYLDKPVDRDNVVIVSPFTDCELENTDTRYVDFSEAIESSDNPEGGEYFSYGTTSLYISPLCDIMQYLRAAPNYNDPNEFILMSDGSRKSLKKGYVTRVRLKMLLDANAREEWWTKSLSNDEVVTRAHHYIVLLSFMCENEDWRSPSQPADICEINDILSTIRIAITTWIEISLSCVSIGAFSLFDWTRNKELERVEHVQNNILHLMRLCDAIKSPVTFTPLAFC